MEHAASSRAITDYLLRVCPCQWPLSVHSSRGFLRWSWRYRKQWSDINEMANANYFEYEGCVFNVRLALLACCVKVTATHDILQICVIGRA